MCEEQLPKPAFPAQFEMTKWNNLKQWQWGFALVCATLPRCAASQIFGRMSGSHRRQNDEGKLGEKREKRAIFAGKFACFPQTLSRQLGVRSSDFNTHDGTKRHKEEEEQNASPLWPHQGHIYHHPCFALSFTTRHLRTVDGHQSI